MRRGTSSCGVYFRTWKFASSARMVYIRGRGALPEKEDQPVIYIGMNVYFRGQEGQLIEAFFDTNRNWRWKGDHGPPPGTLMTSSPSAVTWLTRQGLLCRNVFLQGIDGKLYERFWHADNPYDIAWEVDPYNYAWNGDHGAPPGSTMASAPAAIAWTTSDGTPQINVFLRGEDGQLYERYWNSQNWIWNDGHGAPPGTAMASAPAAVTWITPDGEPQVNVFLRGEDGRLYERFWDFPWMGLE